MISRPIKLTEISKTICLYKFRTLIGVVWISLFAFGGSGQNLIEIVHNADTLAESWNSKELHEAINLYVKALNEAERLKDKELAADCALKASRLLVIVGEPGRGETLLRGISSRLTHYPNLGTLSEIESALAMLTLTDGRTEESRRQVERALDLAKSSNTQAAIYWSNFAAGEYYYNVAQPEKAKDHYDVALVAAQGLSDKSREGETLVSRGYNAIKLYLYDDARNDFTGARAIYQTGNNLRGIAIANIGLGSVSMVGHDRQQAVNYFKQAAAVFPDGIDNSEHGALLSNLGAVYEDHGDLALSTEYRLKALELFRRTRNSIGVRFTLQYLSRLAISGRKWQEATEYLSAAKNIAESANDRHMLGLIAESFGDLWTDRGNYPRAKVFYNNAALIFDSPGFHRQFARVLSARGGIHLSLGEYSLAKADFEKSLNLNSQIKDQFGEADVLFRLATVFKTTGDMRTADFYLDECIRLTNSLRMGVTNTDLRSSFTSTSYDRYELYINIKMNEAKKEKASAVVGLVRYETYRSRSLLENLDAINAETADADPELLRKERNLLVRLNAISNAVVSQYETGETYPQLRLMAQLKDTEHQLSEVRAEIIQKSPVYSAIKNPEPFDVGEFQREVLGENDLLLEFSLGKEESYLWAVDKQDVTAYYLPPREQIEARIDKLRGLLSARQLKQGESLENYNRRLADAEIEYQAEVRALSNDLLGQVKEKLNGKKLIVVADGRLHYFPLGSLPMPGAEDRDPILLTNEVVYEPSAAALKIFRMEKETEAKPKMDLLVFADPVYSKSDERIAGFDTSNKGLVATILSPFRSIESLESMPRLPASEEEAKSISEVVGANQTTVRAGFAANRDGVLNGGIKDYKILHFATHGLIDEKRPELSGILLSLYTDEGKLTDGGFIRLQDVYGMRLNSDLVVLSACDTGIGKEIKGEGIMSLNNAFLQAGAKSVVSSLWKVDDTATKDLMTEFYRGMAEDDLTAAAALRRAQIKMYNNPRYRSPFYWAAFTASGDTDVRVVFTSYARFYAAITAAAIAAAIFALFGVRRLSRRHKLKKPARQ